MSHPWRQKTEWRSPVGSGFLVTVERWPEVLLGRSGPWRWGVYAYIYGPHPRFKKLLDMGEKCTAWNAGEGLPLHGGASWFHRFTKLNGEVLSFQIGADYNHLHDDRFTYYGTEEEAMEVFRDAQALVDALEAEAGAEAQPEAGREES